MSSSSSQRLQAIVYLSIRVEKETLNLGILTTELFGGETADDEAPYVYAGESEMAPHKEDSTAATSDPTDTKESSLV